MNKPEQRAIFLPIDLYEELAENAKKEDRDIKKQAKFIIKQYLQNI